MSKESQLSPFEIGIREFREKKVPFRQISTILHQKYGISVSHNAIYSFLRNREKQTPNSQLFYKNLPPDIKEGLFKQLTALWTYDSTAIEGNTLTLGETIKVLELGLTISGKPLKDHEEVYGHAKAIELIVSLLKQDKITNEDFFNLHRCVMQKSAIDSMRPIGNWKQEHNGTTGIRDGKPIYMQYASPMDTPKLMTRWLKEFNRKLNSATTPAKAINVYAWAHLSFVRIHPFFDGNGRIARLIANLPLLKCGLPPLLISLERRAEYIDLLWNYQNSVGVITAKDSLLPPNSNIRDFKTLLKEEWRQSMQIVKEAQQLAAERSAG